MSCKKGKFGAVKFAFFAHPDAKARQTAEATLVYTLVAEAVWTTSRRYAFTFSTGEEDTSATALTVTLL